MITTQEVVGARLVTERQPRRMNDVLGIVLALLIGAGLAVLAVVLFVANYSIF